MARYKDAVCRLCRREGTKLFLKGDRCFSAKCGVERRGYPPGQHGQGRARFSDYGVQLREKQKVKRMYGLLEKQFASTMQRATRMKGRAGENLIPSITVREGAVVSVREKSRKVTRIAGALDALEGRSVPGWLEIDKDNFTGKVKALPAREDITMPIQEQLIVELYSR
jgi:small subunit ribosomal protein S4